MSAVSYNEYGADSHFTQLLAKKLDWDYVTFARGGCSNSVIRLQIDEAIKLKPDLVIIGTTTPDRVEFPLFPISGGVGLDYWNGVYKKQNGLANINWSSLDLSITTGIFKEERELPGCMSTLESQTINNITQHPDNYFHGFNIATKGIYSSDYMKKLRDVWEDYYLMCYDMNWKKQQDTWAIVSGLQKLKKNNINFFIIPQFMYHEDLLEFQDNMIQLNGKLDPWTQVSKKTRARFHTDLEAQVILAEMWYEFLQEKI
jgi:hypothetical protein